MDNDSDGRNMKTRSGDYAHLLKNSTESFDLADFSPAQGTARSNNEPYPIARHRSGYYRTPSVASRPPLSRDSSFGESVGHGFMGPGLGISDHDARMSSNHHRHSPSFVYTVAGQDDGGSRSASILESGEPNLTRSDSRNVSPYVDTTYDRSRPSFQSGYAHSVNCPSRKAIWIPRLHHLALTLIALSVFSTVLSGLYLLLALVAPRYERLVLGMSFTSAQIVFALFAKLIEMSFVTVFVAFIGQVVSRRAFMKDAGRGISLAEMSMRTWILQPGTMLTNTGSVRHALFSLLGMLAFVAAIVTSLYTTASNALVAPQLSFDHFRDMRLQGSVRSQWFNVYLIEDLCQNPQSASVAGASYTCISLEYAAESYYNFQQYLSSWNSKIRTAADPTDLKQRPPGFAALNENTTVIAPWVEVVNMTQISGGTSRIINNVSMALPHAGVYEAARNDINGIPQPMGLDGLGAYNLRASVPSPVITTICVNISREELAPIVYETWPGANVSAENLDLWPAQVPVQTPTEFLNATAVDDIFGFGPKHGSRRPPIFPIYPIEYNSLANTTGVFPTRDHLYILSKGGKESDYMFNLCSLGVTLTASCSTQFNATSIGGVLSAHCEDPDDEMQYSKSSPNASGNKTSSAEWLDGAGVWGPALSLNSGIFKGNSSLARFLTQLMPLTASLDPTLPSIAEALTVMAGSLTLDGMRLAPFTSSWNWTNATLPEGIYQDTNNVLNAPIMENFKASVSSQTYASGGVQHYQKAFYIVLVAVFAGNLLVLIWFVTHQGLVTDWCEPSNMFGLSINSPPSQTFAGSCGGGPSSHQFKARWFVNVDGEHIYLESEDQEEAGAQTLKPTQSQGDANITKTYTRLSTGSSRL